ncbi:MULTISPECIES: hypothetical protein [Methylococcaceae]|uniref:hypothetical protein n=1 Tax=Methylococcaceae TaxID=403 RepID=UPI001492B185|nr:MULTISPECIES: hypothetical protein [Methylococcaceae]MDP2174129.1 hypothetical protein [Candidatus Cloacimonadaceae bacterium]MDP2179033.1 hypothetical protein [Methylicorpusculum sp.]MDZ4149732.1 hypothetical protein [Methylicorpusculum sp.]NOV29556.1 hypothetical protein [Methylomonas sp. ZR1]
MAVIKGLFFIVLGLETKQGPWWLGSKKVYYYLPPSLEQLQALANQRSDIVLKESDTGSRAERDTLVLDPTGNISGKLYLSKSHLMTKNPDENTLNWMIDIAKQLNGRVKDNRSRTYRSSDDYYVDPKDEEVVKHNASL